MKVAIAQLNYHIGNFEKNRQKIVECIERAKERGADLVLFSELAVCGYYPHDLLERKQFIDLAVGTVEQIAKNCCGIAALVGAPGLNPNPGGKMLYNSAYFLKDGKIAETYNKTLLPTYDVFDEYRHFEPNKEFKLLELNGVKIAVVICEDLWYDQPALGSLGREKLYPISPMEELSRGNPDLIVNISASPFSYDQEKLRKGILLSNAKQYDTPIIYVNQVGAHTDLIFDGGSLFINKHGETVSELNYFKEDFAIIDVNEAEGGDIAKEYSVIEKIHDALVLGIRDYFEKMGFEKATLGLSGGIDSAVTAALAVKALGSKNVRVLLMPSAYSSGHSVDDAYALVKNFNIQHDIINIHEIVDSFQQTLSGVFHGLEHDVTEENIQARIRGSLVMALSNKFGYISLNTSNKSEAAMGYGTLYGDMNGGLSVLGDIYKTDVVKLAKYINKSRELIPNNTIEKPPSAELRPGQKDSDSLPDYEVLDKILFNYIELAKSPEEIVSMGFDAEITHRSVSAVDKNEYKRFQSPPVLRVSSKSFGFGRRMPLVAKYLS